MLRQLIKNLLEKQKVRLLLTISLTPFEAIVVKSLGLFDYDWYGRQYCGGRTEALKQRIPLIHYLVVGRKKGLSPNPFFVGEYYDRWRWHQSILDPLLKYIFRKKTWHQPTSVLFDGGKYRVRSKFIPPLVTYIGEVRRNDDTPVYLDSSFRLDFDKRWSDIKTAMFAGIEARTKQHEVRSIAEPVGVFDYEEQRKTLECYADYFDHKKQPLVSIVMPVWNRQDLIGQAIDSVISQTYSNWELLVVDDGSTDRTVEIVRSYVEKEARIKILTPGHGGVCKARNHGIHNASGKWIAFLDSDNEWTPDFLFGSIASLEDKGSNVAYSAIEMNNNGNVRYRTTRPNLELLETGNFVDLNALVVRRKTLDEIGYFDEGLRRMVDYDLVIRLSKETNFIYVPIVGVNYTDHDNLARISTTESLSWDGVVKNKNYIDWKKKSNQKSNELISIIVPVRGAVAPGVSCLNSLLSCRDDIDGNNVEIIIADASSSSALNITMAAISLIDSRVSYFREAATRDTVLATNYAYQRARGSKIVVLNQQTIIECGWLKPLIDNLDKNTIVGPLQLRPSRVVGSVGVEFFGEDAWPVNILDNHPLSDISNIGEVSDVYALTSGCFAIDAITFANLRGLNPLYDKGYEVQDLCLRAANLGLSSCVIAKRSVVVNTNPTMGLGLAGNKQFVSDWRDNARRETGGLWADAGFRVVGYRESASNNNYAIYPKLEVANREPGKYRWAIKISSPADERRHIWGDTHFAEALAKSLERLGQRVAIDYHDQHVRPTSYLDDIILDLRGLDDTQPQAGALNIMWVISHPEKVTVDIVNRFDLVFAAGKKWAEYMSEQSGKRIEYLPQCTDPEVFHPTEPDPQFANKVLFVGSSRNVLRPIVRDAIAAGIDVNVYGGGWDGLIDPKYIKGKFIPNDKLTYAYSSASVVLNDHWDDMRKWGFISNRIFDVLSSGTLVVTDRVVGLGETIAGEWIAGYTTIKDLRGIANTIQATAKSDMASRDELVEYVRTNHSFDVRSKQLVDKVGSRKRSDENIYK